MLRHSATCQEIQKWVEVRHGFKPETCWIAHCKELYGVPVERAHNRQGEARVNECPPDKRPLIAQAFRHFGLIT